MTDVVLEGDGLSIDDIVAVARGRARAVLSDEARAAMQASRDIVEELAASGQPVYGVSTGFGSLADVYVEPASRARLQAALIRSHAAGMGDAVEPEVVRAMMLLRARTLAMGRSGARPVLADRLLDLLAAGITPRVPEHGSLGCSGDLAPLAHVALVLLGEGEVVEGRDSVDAAVALRAAGIDPIVLEAKEGLALVNGTDGMLGMLALACHDVRGLLAVADIVAAMSVEALLGTDAVFAPEILALRPHPGQAVSAENMRRVLEGSPIVASHRVGDSRVQDAYSLRCAPQVHGAVRDALGYVEGVVRRELDSAIDNPVVLPDGRVTSNGNFHGAPLGPRCGLPRDRARRSRVDVRAARRPAARPGAVARPARVPRGRARCRLGADDRPVHGGRVGGREPPSRHSGERRVDPDVGDAGRSRLDGLGSSTQASGRRR